MLKKIILLITLFSLCFLSNGQDLFSKIQGVWSNTYGDYRMEFNSDSIHYAYDIIEVVREGIKDTREENVYYWCIFNDTLVVNHRSMPIREEIGEYKFYEQVYKILEIDDYRLQLAEIKYNRLGDTLNLQRLPTLPKFNADTLFQGYLLRDSLKFDYGKIKSYHWFTTWYEYYFYPENVYWIGTPENKGNWDVLLFNNRWFLCLSSPVNEKTYVDGVRIEQINNDSIILLPKNRHSDGEYCILKSIDMTRPSSNTEASKQFRNVSKAYWEEMDLRYFTIKTPRRFKYIAKLGFDSQVGEISKRGLTFEYEYGCYSGGKITEIDRYLSWLKSYSEDYAKAITEQYEDYEYLTQTGVDVDSILKEATYSIESSPISIRREYPYRQLVVKVFFIDRYVYVSHEISDDDLRFENNNVMFIHNENEDGSFTTIYYSLKGGFAGVRLYKPGDSDWMNCNSLSLRTSDFSVKNRNLVLSILSSVALIR